LQQSLEDAQSGAGRQQPTRGGLLGWLGRAPEEEVEDESVRQQRLEAQRAVTESCLEHLGEQLEEGQRRGKAALLELVADVRRHSKAFGEKVTVLKPSWRGGSGGAPRGTSSGGGKLVGGLIKSLSTVEGRQQHRAAEEAAEAKNGTSVRVVEEAPMLAPPVESIASGEWRIRGVYEHQVLKAGLRLLDKEWPTDNLLDFPRGKDGVLREKLLGDLLGGKIRLQSVLNNEVAAAQKDVQKLTLRQLLRLRVLHIDFTPSGCGADTVHSVGGTHEAFLSTVDTLLFRQLGKRATCDVTKDSASAANGNSSDLHRLGREAVFLAAAAAAVTTSPWWCWWLTDERRVFFHAGRFAAAATFPEDSSGGVLEVTDYSRADRHDPSGKLRWLDWRVVAMTEEAKLASTPLRGDIREAGTSSGYPAAGMSSASAREEVSTPEKKPSSVGAAAAGLVSPELLSGMRKGLKKTGGPGAGVGNKASPQQQPESGDSDTVNNPC